MKLLPWFYLLAAGSQSLYAAGVGLPEEGMVDYRQGEYFQAAQNLIKFRGSDASFYYTVRCSWLKSPVSEPQFLDTCEGKQQQKGDN